MLARIEASSTMVTRGMKAKALMIIIRMITAQKLQMMRWRAVLFFACNSKSVTVTACPGGMSRSGLAVKFTAKDKSLPDVFSNLNPPVNLFS